jgi:tetratricopeptide (TPR) repeat protein
MRPAPNPQRLKDSDSVHAPLLQEYTQTPEARQAVVWKRVSEKLQPRGEKYLWFYGLASVAAGALLVMGFKSWFSPQRPTTAFVVQTAAADAPKGALTLGSSLNAGSAPLLLSHSKASLLASPQTRFRLHSDDSAQLEFGALAVTALSGFVVETPTEVFELKTGIAGISVNADGTVVFIEEGAAVARTRRQNMAISAGQTWPAGGNAKVAREALASLHHLRPIAALVGATPEQLIEQARTFSTRAQAPKAIEAYTKAISAPGHSGQIALYERGLLRQKTLGDAEGALADFDTYQSRFPSGALIAEVALNRIEVLLELHRDDLALAQMNVFVEQRLADERLDEVILMRGRLLQLQGRCSEALKDFVLVKGPTLKPEARWSQARCENAAAAMRQFLTDYPTSAHASEAQAWLLEHTNK